MSSNTPLLQVEHVSKCFHIYDNPKDRLKQLLLQGKTDLYREFWALRDVSFEVGRGHTVGIIGENGSGKSTLLQIITGTMFPTTGSVQTKGRIAALLELGSGFNPEFTGRENVYLNGSLLGVSREQMNEKFDYIAGFADIGIHLDQPVKTYSSGMMLRLAFAVQIAVETEMLIIDEALAVGDARFQKKCFKRLEELKEQGTTILFVSHAVELVRSFCDYGLVLEKGNAVYWGDARGATVKYLSLIYPSQAKGAPLLTTSDGSQIHYDETEAHVLKVIPSNSPDLTFGVGGAQLDWLKLSGGEIANSIQGGKEITIRAQFSWDVAFIEQYVLSEKYPPYIGAGFALTDTKGNFVFGCNAYDAGIEIAVNEGKATFEFNLSCPHLAAGKYFITFDITVGDLAKHIQLQWYDSLVQVECLPSEKKAFGMMAVDYTLLHVEA